MKTREEKLAYKRAWNKRTQSWKKYRVQTKRYYEANKEKLAQQRLHRLLPKLYNVSLEDYNVLFDLQKGLCALCGRPPGSKRLGVDHDHLTGNVRELLCSVCNMALGGFNDDPQLLRAAADYIEKHRI